MHVRVFEAPTLERAQAAVREALGADALILGIEQATCGLKITAAIEPETDVGALLAAPPTSFDPTLKALLTYHGVPPSLQAKVAASGEGGTLAQGLANGLAGAMRTATPGNRHLLVGPPGHGRTLQAARLARALHAAGEAPRVLAVDDESAAGGSAIARWLDGTAIEVTRVADDADLAVAAAQPGAVIIDTPGLSPLVAGGSDRLRTLVRLTANTEPTLVLSVELPAIALLELTADYLAIGCRSVLPSKLDLTVRQGALTALALSGTPLLPASVGGKAEDPLSSLTPGGLARLLVQRFHASQSKTCAGGRE